MIIGKAANKEKEKAGARGRPRWVKHVDEIPRAFSTFVSSSVC
jgi:hypothetical protein